MRSQQPTLTSRPTQIKQNNARQQNKTKQNTNDGVDRFAATIGELTGGRVGLCAGSVGVLKGAVTIAVRYSSQRQQFGPPGAPEVAVLDYQSQQQKLIPLLAAAYGLHFAKERLVER